MGLVIGFFVASIIFFVSFFVFSKLRYKTRFNTIFNIKNMFPYELNFRSKFKENLLGNISLILFALSALGFYIFAAQKSLLPYSTIIILCASFLFVILTTSLVFVPLDAVKLHLGVSIFSMVFTFVFFGVIGYVSMDYFQNFKENSYLVLAIISIVICLGYFGVSMNPKLNAPLNYEEVKNEDGSVSYRRPKFFVLAFSEWLVIFANILGLILTLILYLL